MTAAPFEGFPDGRLAATPLPNLFFSQVLGPIEDLAELKLTLFLFWRIGEKRGYPRFVTQREILADRTVIRGLAGPENVLRALQLAARRGTLLWRTMMLAGQPEECYFLNTASGRQSIEQLEAGTVEIGQTVLPREPAPPERPNIFVLYEQNVGLLSPLLADELRAAEEQYPAEWVADAFKEAVALNRRSWRYIQRILERWATEGRGDEAAGRRRTGTKNRPYERTVGQYRRRS